MKNRFLNPWMLIALCLLGPAAVAAAEEGQRSETFGRIYEIHHLDLHVAEVLAWDQCAKSADDRCVVMSAGSQDGLRALSVRADRDTHESIARVLAQRDVESATRSFQLTVLVAGEGAGGIADTVPSQAREALDDLLEFLPYKSYDVLDLAFFRTRSEIDVKLDNPRGGELRISLGFEEAGTEGDQLLFRHFQVTPIPGSQLLSTSFSMTVGETVVVGTSKLDGEGEALVVLLTAVE